MEKNKEIKKEDTGLTTAYRGESKDCYNEVNEKNEKKTELLPSLFRNPIFSENLEYENKYYNNIIQNNLDYLFYK